MKQKFKEFYKPTPEEIDDFWANAIFSFDANILLNLYRYTNDTCNEVLETLKYLSEQKRLWITYQAAFEYQKNRLTVISTAKSAYRNLIEKLAEKNKEIVEELNKFKKHQTLNIEGIKEEFAGTFKKATDDLTRLEEDHPNLLEDDPIFDALTRILEGCIGDTMSEDELNLIYKEGKSRYEKKIPPGYKDLVDKKNEPERSLYGDLIIWKELIKYIKTTPSKLIFVTDDLKEDWWHIVNGRTINSKPELAREFFAETKNEIIIYKPEQFLKFFKDRVKHELKEETIKEVEETRKNDEIIYTHLPDASLYSIYPTDFIGNLNVADYYKNKGYFLHDLLQSSGSNVPISIPSYLTPELLRSYAGSGAAHNIVTLPDWLKKYENLTTVPVVLTSSTPPIKDEEEPVDSKPAEQQET